MAHRTAATRARAAGLPESIAEVVVDLPDAPVSEGPVTLATRARLEAAGRLDSPQGQRAILAAQRMESGHEHGSAVASLMAQHQLALNSALEGAKAEPDALDELEQRRRDRARRAGIG